MKKAVIAVLFCVVGVCVAFAQQAYQPPKVTFAGDAYVPYQIVVDGLFVLEVRLSDTGKIQHIVALRNPGSMLGAAKTSVRSWKFQPASSDGMPVDSRLTAVLVYRPANFGGAGAVPPKNFTPVFPPEKSEDKDADGYIPVGIFSFTYPNYPSNSVAWGSVVVEATVNDAGDVSNVRLLHAMAGFNSFALDALSKWRFRPASFRGKPITADVAIAFVFQTPTSAH